MRYGKLCFLLLFCGTAAADTTLLGFSDAAPQLELEANFRAQLDAEDQYAWAKALSARPHHAGQPADAQRGREVRRSRLLLGAVVRRGQYGEREVAEAGGRRQGEGGGDGRTH